MKVDQGKLKHCPPACTLTSSIRAYLAILEPLYSLSIQDEVRGLQILLALDMSLQLTERSAFLI